MKKTITVAVCVVAIIAAIVIIISQVNGRGASTLPSDMAGEKIDLVDKDTLQTVSMTRGDFQKAERKDGYIKNPVTGSFSLTSAIICESCNAKVPDVPVVFGPNAPSVQRDAAWMQAQVCPKCKKCPYAQRLKGT